MSYFTIGTAGHVDHGKSTLVEALTGVHPDRLKEERDRGMTIDLGFAFMPLKGPGDVPIIDVPGHEKFLNTMVAGVSGINLVLFVVAADEGVMPQTVEHLSTLKYIGVTEGIIVLTKCDLVDEEWLMLVEEDVKLLVKDSFLAGSPVIQVSSETKLGINVLATKIEETIRKLPSKMGEKGYFRMPIDRVFTMKGFGTIIAGTVHSGTLSINEEIELLPTQQRLRIRGIRSNNEPIGHATKGQRIALNVPNIKAIDIQRGYEIGKPGYLHPTMMIDAKLNCLESVEPGIQNRERIRLHKGTSETIARVVLLSHSKLDPGDTAYVQFRLEKPIVAERTESFIIRGFSNMRLLGGGKIIEVYPRKSRRFRKPIIDYLRAIDGAAPEILIEKVMLQAYGSQRLKNYDDLISCTNLLEDDLHSMVDLLKKKGCLVESIDHRLMHIKWYSDLKDEIVSILKKMHRLNRLKEMVPKDAPRSHLSWQVPDLIYGMLLSDLEKERKIILAQGLIRLFSHSVSLTKQEQQVLTIFDQMSETDPPIIFSINEITLVMAAAVKQIGDLSFNMKTDGDMIKEMSTYAIEQGTFVEFADRQLIHQKKLEKIKENLVLYLKNNTTIRAADFRTHIQISRSHATGLLDYFCDVGVTKRESGTHTLRDC